MSFIDIIDSISGRRGFVINLLEGIQDGSISRDDLNRFAKEAEARLSVSDPSDPDARAELRRDLNSIVFRPNVRPDGSKPEFSYLAKLSDETECEVMSFLTWSKLVRLIPEGSELEEAIRRTVDRSYLDRSDSRPPSELEMQKVAELVNEIGPKTDDFRVTPSSSDGKSYPLWITICDDFVRFYRRGEEDLAGRMRDWLGLGHMTKGMPVFAFKSKDPLPETRRRPVVARPTVFDGIGSSYFKHRPDERCSDGWGRTLDLKAADEKADKCDGGPEAVTPGMRFGNLFHCSFVGHIGAPPLDHGERILDALLRGSHLSGADFPKLKELLKKELEGDA